MTPEAKAALQAIDDTAERIRKMNKENIESYQRRSQPADNPSAIPPVILESKEYAPPTPAELYEACQAKNEIWKRHMDEVAKLWQ